MTSQGSEPGYRRWLAQAYADYQETEVLPADSSDARDGCRGLVTPAEAGLAQARQTWSIRYEVLRVTATEQRDFALLASGSEAADCYSEQADDAERIGGILRRAGHARQAAEDAVARTLRWRPGEPVMPRRTAFRVGKGGGEPVTPARAVTDVGPVRRRAAEMPGNSEPVALAWRSQQPACDRGPQGPEPVF